MGGLIRSSVLAYRIRNKLGNNPQIRGFKGGKLKIIVKTYILYLHSSVKSVFYAFFGRN